MADFPTTPRPDYPIEEACVEPEVLVSKHRDGTEQRRLKGAGAKRTFKLRFSGLTNAQRQTLVNHYAGQSGNLLAFSWTHPERAEVYTVRYQSRPTFTLESYAWYSGQVELQEVPA